MEEQVTNRLGVIDKRELFQVLMSMVERLFDLNRFPVDMEDFALSLQTPEVEAAWNLMKEDNQASLSPSNTQQIKCNDNTFKLHTYPGDTQRRAIFMDVPTFDITHARRHEHAVTEWCRRQFRLENQLLRACETIKAVVHSCNTVGQYKRVSPDLLTFLPDKYRAALKNYKKTSPYPDTGLEVKDIDTMLSTLAFAAMQPMHPSEEQYKARLTSYYKPHYSLANFPRGRGYDSYDSRNLRL